MSKRQFLILLSALLILLNFYLYMDMTHKYNEDDMVFQMTVKDVEALEDILLEENVTRFLLESEGAVGSTDYVMVYGNISDFYDFELSKGSLNLGGITRQVVIGDQVADRLFKTIDCLEKTFELNGSSYEIVGVLKGSNTVYMSYDETLTIPWTRQTLHMLPPVGQRPEFYQDYIKYKLLKEQMTYDQFKLNKWYSDLFINICVLQVLIILLYIFILNMNKFKLFYEVLRTRYKAEHRTLTVVDFVKKHVIALSKVIASVGLLGFFIFLFVKSFQYLRISSYFLPVNFLSLKDYEVLFTKIFDDWAYALKSGLYDIEIDYLKGILINLLIVSTSSILYLIKYSLKKDEQHS